MQGTTTTAKQPWPTCTGQVDPSYTIIFAQSTVLDDIGLKRSTKEQSSQQFRFYNNGSAYITVTSNERTAPFPKLAIRKKTLLGANRKFCCVDSQAERYR